MDGNDSCARVVVWLAGIFTGATSFDCQNKLVRIAIGHKHHRNQYIVLKMIRISGRTHVRAAIGSFETAAAIG